MFFIQYGSDILYRTKEHIILVTIAMSIAITIGIPLGILITKQPKLATGILGIANAIQTIPSLAIFGFLISVPLLGGIGKTPAIIALSLYALLPLIRNTYVGINQVPHGVKEAGLSLGFTPFQILYLIELPLALKIILAGVRIATVICVGIATIAAAIGGGGLGVFIFRGISTVNNELILAGSIPAAIIALIADGGFSYIEYRFTSYRPNKKGWIWFGLLFMGLISFILLGNLWNNGATQLTIGSKNFTEQVILGEMLAQRIETTTNLKVARQFNLGGTLLIHEALKNNKIDAYVEYTGTALTNILKAGIMNNRQGVWEFVKQSYQEKFKLEVMKSLGFENTFAIIIRQEDATKYNIKTISDSAQYTPQWKAGFGTEFLSREDGYSGFTKRYGLKFAQPPEEMELGLVYQAVAQKQIDFSAGNSTDGLISAFKLVMLEDDKKYFPPYDAVPIFTDAILTKYPQIRSAIEPLLGKITVTEMQQLNYLVDNQRQPIKEVVANYLKNF